MYIFCVCFRSSGKKRHRPTTRGHSPAATPTSPGIIYPGATPAGCGRRASVASVTSPVGKRRPGERSVPTICHCTSSRKGSREKEEQSLTRTGTDEKDTKAICKFLTDASRHCHLRPSREKPHPSDQILGRLTNGRRNANPQLRSGSVRLLTPNQTQKPGQTSSWGPNTPLGKLHEPRGRWGAWTAVMVRMQGGRGHQQRSRSRSPNQLRRSQPRSVLPPNPKYGKKTAAFRSNFATVAERDGCGRRRREPRKYSDGLGEAAGRATLKKKPVARSRQSRPLPTAPFGIEDGLHLQWRCSTPAGPVPQNYGPGAQNGSIGKQKEAPVVRVSSLPRLIQVAPSFPSAGHADDLYFPAVRQELSDLWRYREWKA